MKPVFTGNPDFNRTAFMNWRFDAGSDILNLLNLAEGYMDAAIALATVALADNQDKQADVLIFPMLMNANHGIELYLKALNWTLNQLLDKHEKKEGSHNIQQIYQMAQGKIKEYGKPSLKTFNLSTKNLRSYLKELFDKINANPRDDKMDFSRYPMNKNYDDHFYVGTFTNVEVDLDNFILRFEEMKTSLQTVTDFLYYNELMQDS